MPSTKKNALPAPPQKKRDFLDESDDEDAQPVSALGQLRVNEGFAKRLEVRRRTKEERKALKRRS